MIIYDKQKKILKLFIKKTDEYIEKDDLHFDAEEIKKIKI